MTSAWFFPRIFRWPALCNGDFLRKIGGMGDPSSVEPTDFVCWPTLFSTMHSWGRSRIERRLLKLRQWIGLNEIELPIKSLKPIYYVYDDMKTQFMWPHLQGVTENKLRWHNVFLMFASLYILIFGSSKIHPNVVRFTAWRFICKAKRIFFLLLSLLLGENEITS